MTKFKLLSDLHIEGWEYKYIPNGEDVLVLAGDIHTRYRHEDLIKQVPENIKILMVLGNHENYHAVYEDVVEHLKDLEGKYSNFKLLDKESIEINDISIYGGMMCTNFELYGKENALASKHYSQMGINDFRMSYRERTPGERSYWNTDDHLQEYNEFETGLNIWLEENKMKKKIVISHFAPHKQTIARQFAGSELNPYFTTDMDKYMGLVDIWMFGHTHSSYDNIIKGTRVIANPKGYGLENMRSFNDKLLIEI